jgi:hypothetical protein
MENKERNKKERNEEIVMIFYYVTSDHRHHEIPTFLKNKSVSMTMLS